MSMMIMQMQSRLRTMKLWGMFQKNFHLSFTNLLKIMTKLRQNVLAAVRIDCVCK